MSGHVLNYLITADTKSAHKATWYAWAGGQKIRACSTMRGTWGWDVTCSCGWESHTGGATRGSVEDDLWDHRHSAQCEAERQAQGA